MALHHAKFGEVVDLKSWGAELGPDKSKAICKTDELELIRMCVPAGREIATHQVDGSLVLQCLEGKVDVQVNGETKPLRVGELVHLEPKAPHALKAETDAVLLLTIVFKQ